MRVGSHTAGEARAKRSAVVETKMTAEQAQSCCCHGGKAEKSSRVEAPLL